MGIVLLLLVKFYKKDQAICQSIFKEEKTTKDELTESIQLQKLRCTELHCTFPDYSDLATLFCRVIQFPGITSPIYLLSGSVDSLHHQPTLQAQQSKIQNRHFKGRDLRSVYLITKHHQLHQSENLKTKSKA